jgi:hypothetical protein
MLGARQWAQGEARPAACGPLGSRALPPLLTLRALLGHLVHLINEHDAVLRRLDIEVCRLRQGRGGRAVWAALRGMRAATREAVMESREAACAMKCAPRLP